MSKLKLTLLLLVNIAMTTHTSRAQYRDFRKLLDENRLFELRDAFRENSGVDLAEWEKLFFSAFIDNAFGYLDKSNEAIDKIFTNYNSNVSRKDLIALLSCQADNYSKEGDYKSASRVIDIAIEKYGKLLTKSQIKQFENSHKVWKSIADVPTQKIVYSGKNEETVVPIVRNQFNHWTIPVKSSAESENSIDFVFDTGANISTIKKSVAESMGVVGTGNFIDVGNSVGSKIKAEMGYIPMLFIGDLEIENVVFLIVADETLTFEQVDYSIEGIIGFPVIRGLGEFRISNDGKLTIPHNLIVVPALGNMFTSGFMPHVRAKVDGEDVTLICDTGALTSHLSNRYYKAHKSSIDSKSSKSRRNVGGAGGNKDVTNRMLTDLEITVASRTLKMDSMEVLVKTPKSFKHTDGFLGQDVLLKPHEVVMNFKDLYIYFKD